MPELGILGNHVLLDLDSSGNLTWPNVTPRRRCWELEQMIDGISPKKEHLSGKASIIMKSLR